MAIFEKTTENKFVNNIDVVAEKALYTPPLKNHHFPASGATVHTHDSSNKNKLFGGDIRPIGSNSPNMRLTSYECSMADHFLTQGGINPIMPKKY